MLLSIFFFVFHHHSLFVCLSLDAVKTQKFRIKFVYLQGKYPSCLESCFKWNTSCSDTLSPVVLANVSSKEEWEVRNPRNAKISCMHIYFGPVNPFIYFTPSRPLISSGSWLTLHNCDIYYLSAVKYDPATTDLIFIRVNIYPGPGEGGLQLISEPVYFIRVTIYPAAFSYNISRGHYLPRGPGRGGPLLIFQPIYFYQGHYLPRHLIPQY
jgi:hypothetical protein